jgi:hypothetical protein
MLLIGLQIIEQAVAGDKSALIDFKLKAGDEVCQRKNWPSCIVVL